MWKGLSARQRWPDHSQLRPRDASKVAGALLAASGLISLWGFYQGTRTFQAWRLCLEAAAVGLILIVSVRVFAGSRSENPFLRGTPFRGVSLAVILIAMTVALDSNCSLPSRQARVEHLLIAEKQLTNIKGGHGYRLIVLADGQPEAIYVSKSEWDQAQAGGVFTTTVWTGYWGFRYIGPPGQR
jgi:hypothetical protein